MAHLAPFFPKSEGKPWGDDKKLLIGIIYMNRNTLRGAIAVKILTRHGVIAAVALRRRTRSGMLVSRI